jgi:hypothetical protein
VTLGFENGLREVKDTGEVKGFGDGDFAGHRRQREMGVYEVADWFCSGSWSESAADAYAERQRHIRFSRCEVHQPNMTPRSPTESRGGCHPHDYPEGTRNTEIAPQLAELHLSRPLV